MDVFEDRRTLLRLTYTFYAVPAICRMGTNLIIIIVKRRNFRPKGEEGNTYNAIYRHCAYFLSFYYYWN